MFRCPCGSCDATGTLQHDWWLLQVNPVPEGFDPLAPMENPMPTPVYKPWVDPVEKSVAFEQLDALFEERMVLIDGAMGTNIQEYKLDENDYRGERYKVLPSYCESFHPFSGVRWSRHALLVDCRMRHMR